MHILNWPPSERSDRDLWDISLKHRGLIITISRSHGKRNSDILDDLIQIGHLAVYKAAQNYLPPYNQKRFNAYATKHIRSLHYKFFLNERIIEVPETSIRRKRSEAIWATKWKKCNISQYDIPVSPESNSTPLVDIDQLLSPLKDNERLAVELHFFQNRVAREIAPILNVHATSVTRTIRRLLRKCKNGNSISDQCYTNQRTSNGY